MDATLISLSERPFIVVVHRCAQVSGELDRIGFARLSRR